MENNDASFGHKTTPAWVLYSAHSEGFSYAEHGDDETVIEAGSASRLPLCAWSNGCGSTVSSLGHLTRIGCSMHATGKAREQEEAEADAERKRACG